MERSLLTRVLDTLSHGIQAATAFYQDPLTARPPGPGGFARQLRIGMQLYRQLGEDRCYQQASGLSYKTVLSVVPMAAVALSLLKAFGAFSGPDSPTVRFVAGLVMPPNEAQLLAEKIIEFTAQISFGAIGGIGMLSLVLVAVSLLETVDETINQIWKGKHQRSRFTRFTTFYTMLTLGPLLLTVSLLQSGRLQGLLFGDVLSRLLTIFTPLGITWATLVLSYKLFPTVKVQWKPAMIGALIAALGIEAVKFAFSLFLSESLSTSYAKIYGALALIPLFLVWIYVLWLIVLVGVEYSAISQHYDLLVRQRLAAKRHRQRLPSPEAQVGEHLACRILLLVGRAFDGGRPAPAREEIPAALGVDQVAADVTVQMLADLGFLRLQGESVEGEEEGRDLLYPARSLQLISLRDVVVQFRRAYGGVGQVGSGDEALDRYLRKMDECLTGSLADTTLAELVSASPGSQVTLPAV